MIKVLEVCVMSFIQSEGNRKLKIISQIFGLSLLIILFVAAGSISCKKKTEEGEALEEVTVIKKGMNEFEDVVKVGVGKYFFIPGAQGIDMVVPGQIESGDSSSLEGKRIRVRGEFSHEKPSILVVETIDVEEAEGEWRNIYIKTEDVVLDDYLDSRDREKFKPLKKLDYTKKDVWEGIGKGKVYGKLEKTTVTQGEEEKDVYNIIVWDEKGEIAGQIIVDNITDYSLYYLKKLRLFDKFWLYINVKETVDWKIRKRTRDLFHADVVFAGLY